MRKILILVAAVSLGSLTVAGEASAQNFYFGFGNGPGWGGYGPRPYYGAPPYYSGPRYYRSYPAYGYGNCYWTTRRYFSEYRGGWVVRRVRVCD